MSPKVDLKGFYEKDVPEMHRHSWSDDELPSRFKKLGEIHLKTGDLVTWDEHPDAQYKGEYYTPAYVNKHQGIVLATKWFRTYMDNAHGFYERSDACSPMILVLWGDGETTSTSQSCLVKLS